MHSLNITYILLIITILVSLFCRDKRAAYLGIGITILAALYQGIINIVGVGALSIFTAITYSYFNLQLNKVIKTLLFTSISVFLSVLLFIRFQDFLIYLSLIKYRAAPPYCSLA